MTSTVPIVAIFFVAITLGIFTLLNSSTGRAGEEKELAKRLDAIAAVAKKGDMKTVKKLSEKLAKEQEEVYYVMLLLKPRNKKGVGVGPSPGKILPDGIELKLKELAKNPIGKAQLNSESNALIEMGFRMAALGHFSREIPQKPKDQAKWNKFCNDMQRLSIELVTAIRTQNPVNVKKAAAKLNTNCNQCHSVFR